MTQHTQGGPRVWRALAALIASGLTASCVTQQQYDDARALVKQYQTENFDLNAENTRLLQENQRLNAQVRDNTMILLENASYSAAEQRLDELQGMLQSLGRPPGDIERFELDGGYLYMIQDKLLFASGKAELGEEGRAALRGIARTIAGAPHGIVYVRGHTDDDPVVKPETLRNFPHGNIQLSAERAVAVAALMLQTGDVPEDQIRVMGFGPHEPLVSNDGPANKRLNRRVEIYVTDPGQ